MAEVIWKLENATLAGTYVPRLSGIDCEIRPGITAVLGPSGSGKTSLLNLLVAFESPDEGSVTGTIERGGHSLPVYWVPQTGGLWPHLKGRQHLERALPGGAGAEDVETMLAAFDLAGRGEAYPDQLSQGERSRLAVARALLADAAVIVMDEPLAHVDTAQAARYWDVIRKHLSRRGGSLVFATHVPKTVMAEAEHVVCLREGRLLFDGEVSELYRHPATRELAECLGEVNWLEPEEARLWFATETDEPLCVRPEQVSVTPAADGAVVVKRSRFKGGVAEVELEHAEAKKTLSLFHRPSGDDLRPGDRVVLKAALLVLFALMIGCESSEAPLLAVSEVRHWSMPPAGAMIPAPRTVGVAGNDDVIVLDTRGRVLVFDQAGAFKRRWRMPEIEAGNPEGVCVLKDGRIAVADTHYCRVIFFDRTGNEVGRFGGYGKKPGEFIYPVALVEDGQRNLYVCEYGGNDRVQKFTRDGKFILAFGSFGTGPEQFQRPSGMVWHKGKLYVADAINNRIQVFTDSGKFLGKLEDPARPLSLRFPYDIALGADGALYVVEYAGARVSKVSLDGKLLGRYGRSGAGRGQLRTPWGIAVDSKMRLRIADTGNRRIVALKQ